MPKKMYLHKICLMKILHFYPARFPVTMYGGTPRITQWLAREQAKAGHQVYLMALEGSSLEGVEVIGFPENATSEELDRLVPGEVEIIHAYTYGHKHDFKKPFIITHDRMGMVRDFHPNTVFVSKRHAQIHGSNAFIHYGLPAEEYPFTEQKEDYLIFLALASWPVKNLEGAIRVARDAGIKLVIAGGYRLSLDRRIKSLGVLGDKNKKEWLRRAKALIFPVIWDEPFGIVMIEAFACGTPVVGTSFGSLPEVIAPDRGFVCQSHREMVEAVQKLGQISPQKCRAAAENYFHIRRMAEQYFAFYQEILATGYFDKSNQPRLKSDLSPALNLRYYDGYRPANRLWRKLGPYLNSGYARYRNLTREFTSDEIPSRDLSV